MNEQLRAAAAIGNACQNNLMAMVLSLVDELEENPERWEKEYILLPLNENEVPVIAKRKV